MHQVRSDARCLRSPEALLLKSACRTVVSWILLIGLPSFVLGVGPLVVSAWLGKLTTHASAFFTGIWPVVVLSILAVVLGWLGGRPSFRLFENSFWSLQALGVQPAYAICREGLRHVLEKLLPSGIATARRNATRAAGAAMSALLIGAVAFGLAAAPWSTSRWVGRISLTSRPCTFSYRSHSQTRSSSSVSILPSRLLLGASQMRQWPNRGICSPSPPTLRAIESGAWFTSRIFMLWASAMDFVSRADDRDRRETNGSCRQLPNWTRSTRLVRSILS